MNHDMSVKRAEFISKSTEIRESFSFASPVEVLKAVKVFVGDFYGSNLWRLGSQGAARVYNSWNKCIKLAWNVPHGTHTYFVEHTLNCGFSHVKTDILSRYIKFFKALRTSPSMEVSVLAHIVARDVRTTTGSNLQLVRDMTGLDPWKCFGSQVRKEMDEKLVEVPEMDKWRIVYLEKLLEQRGELFYKLEDTSEITGLIDSICVN